MMWRESDIYAVHRKKQKILKMINCVFTMK
jgi:hypothetical protein